MKIALLGAGHIGRTVASLLHSCGDYQVRVFDKDSVVLSQIEGLGFDVQLLNSDQQSDLIKALQGFDAVANALPYHLATTVAHCALTAGCHYFDLTEDVTATQNIRHLAANAKTAFMPQCGLAPGFIGIVANHITKSFDSLYEVKMRAGALPAFPTNALKYNLTWSVDGLVNEYCRPCEAIRDGKRINVLPLEGLEHFSLDGTEYEAFNTSGGLGTLCQTLQGRVRHLDYKTVRYPGHRDLMSFLLDELRMKEDQEELKTILRRSMPITMQDVVLVFVTVSGMKNGVFLQEVFAHKIFAERKDSSARSAIQITTAASICAVIDLFCEGHLPHAGFIAQEQVELPAFLSNRFGQAYQQSRRVESIG